MRETLLRFCGRVVGSESGRKSDTSTDSTGDMSTMIEAKTVDATVSMLNNGLRTLIKKQRAPS